MSPSPRRRRFVGGGAAFMVAVGIATAVGLAIAVGMALGLGVLRPDRLASEQSASPAVAAALR